MNVTGAFIPFPAALLWIACRDERAIERASALNGEMAIGAALFDLGAIGTWDLVNDPEADQLIEVLTLGAGPLLALQWALASGRIIAIGDDGSGQMRDVPVAEWAGLRVGLNDQASREGVHWRQLVVLTAKLMEVFPGPISKPLNVVVQENGKVSASALGTPGRTKPYHGEIRAGILREIEILRGRPEPRAGRNVTAKFIVAQLAARGVYASEASAKSILTEQNWIK